MNNLKEVLESIKTTIQESCIVDGEDVICTPEVMLWIENKIVDYGEEIKSESEPPRNRRLNFIF